jgi:hypothetical protein
MACVESVKQSPQVLTEHSGCNSLYDDLISVFGPTTRKQDTVATMLTEYSYRKLTHDTDILNACRGVLKSICRFHLCGVPLEIDESGNVQAKLLWKTHQYQRSHRRIGFPSWSWTGWQSPVYFHPTDKANELSCTVEVPGCQGQWQSLAKYVEMEDLRGRTVQTEDVRSLRITAPHMPITAFTTEASSLTRPEHMAHIAHSKVKDWYLSIDFECDTGDRIEEQLAGVVALAMYYSESGGSPHMIGVLFEPAGTVYKRVGTMRSTAWTSKGSSKKMRKWLSRAKMRTIVVE